MARSIEPPALDAGDGNGDGSCRGKKLHLTCVDGAGSGT